MRIKFIQIECQLTHIYNYLDGADSTTDMSKKLIPKIKAIVPHLCSMCILEV